jgi:hypothetical protein
MRFPSYRVFSLRSILTFVLAVVMTALLWATIGSTATHAADPASWNGAAIKFDGLQFTSGGKVQASDGLPIPVDSPYYIYSENFTPVGSSVMTERVRIIYFTPGTDPPTATSATHVRFDYDATTKKYSAAYDQTTISITPASQDSSASATTCAIDGIGWAVCPIMNFLSKGMDVIFTLISDFMKVQPLQTGNTQGSLYTAWSIMRTFANIALIIVFIIIIYSQLTNIQVSNYGIKRILPRLIIAAIAINLSYVICALAVDISNVLGFSLQQLFIGLKDQVLASGNTDNSAALLSWESITGFVLSGGTAALAGGVAVGSALVVAGGSIGAATTAAVFILLPSLVGLLLAILVVLLILAARQALIIILVIIAPLAIVAYMLPNTEKWFKKWQETLMTMLIFFPAFAVVFGGSQLAGAVIIKNATSINMIILGMIVQVAPLVITPLLLKFSGGLLGSIARIANNPNKGIMDRTRNWSKGHADWHNARGLGQLDRHGNPILGADGKPVPLKKNQIVRKSARYLDQRKRLRTDRTSNGESAAQTAYEDNTGGAYAATYRFGKKKGTTKYDMAEQKAYFDTNKERVHSEHAAHVDHARRTQGSMLFQPTVNTLASKDNAEASQKATETFYNNARRDKKMAGGVLHASGYKLEDAKMKLETSEKLKEAYYTEQRNTKGTDLYARVKPLETSKLKLEGAQSQYTAMVDTMKAQNGTKISIAAQQAQSSKEHLEEAQGRLQAFFDTRRADPNDGILNKSTLRLEDSKSVAEEAKAELSAYIATQRATKGSSLHLRTIEAEQAKQAQQVADTGLSRIIDEYKSGAIDASTLTADEQSVMQQMVQDTEQLAAESRGVQAAQNQQKKRIAEAFTETVIDPNTGKKVKSARAEALLKIAQSVDPYGDVRAEADALSTLDQIVNAAREANETLLEERAVSESMTPKDYAVQLLENRVGGDTSESEDLIRAAMEIAGKEAQIPIIRKMRKSGNFNQDHLTAMILRNDTTMKTKGGFDLQADMGLIGASDEVMNSSIAGTLGSVSAENFIDLKNGAFKEYVKDFDTIMSDTDTTAASNDTKERSYGSRGKMGLQSTYFNLTTALKDSQIVRRLGDNLVPAIDMHKKLHARFNNDEMSVDYHLIDPREA